jgi:hypothetical protein
MTPARPGRPTAAVTAAIPTGTAPNTRLCTMVAHARSRTTGTCQAHRSRRPRRARGSGAAAAAAATKPAVPPAVMTPSRPAPRRDCWLRPQRPPRAGRTRTRAAAAATPPRRRPRARYVRPASARRPSCCRRPAARRSPPDTQRPAEPSRPGRDRGIQSVPAGGDRPHRPVPERARGLHLSHVSTTSEGPRVRRGKTRPRGQSGGETVLLYTLDHSRYASGGGSSITRRRPWAMPSPALACKKW